MPKIFLKFFHLDIYRTVTTDESDQMAITPRIFRSVESPLLHCRGAVRIQGNSEKEIDASMVKTKVTQNKVGSFSASVASPIFFVYYFHLLILVIASVTSYARET